MTTSKTFEVRIAGYFSEIVPAETAEDAIRLIRESEVPRQFTVDEEDAWEVPTKGKHIER